jgi:hypothetical protein
MSKKITKKASKKRIVPSLLLLSMDAVYGGLELHKLKLNDLDILPLDLKDRTIRAVIESSIYHNNNKKNTIEVLRQRLNAKDYKEKQLQKKIIELKVKVKEVKEKYQAFKDDMLLE